MRKIFFCFTVLLLLAGLGCALALRSYHLLSREELAAVIECRPAPEAPYYFELVYTPVVHDRKGSSIQFSMYGDQWMIGGDFLKWHPWLNFVGLKNCYKLTRLNSRYSTVQQEINQPHSIYDLNGGTDLFWRGLYRYRKWIPCAEAIYGNSTYCFAQPGTRWGLYVTLSGYILKPLERHPAVLASKPA